MIGFLLLQRVAHKLVYYMRGAGAVCAGVLSLPRIFPRAGPTRLTFMAFLASLVMAFLLGFFWKRRSA